MAQTLDRMEEAFVDSLALNETLVLPKVQRELEIVPEQAALLAETLDRKHRRHNRVEAENKIREILLPHQFLRLRQIRLQIALGLGHDPAFGVVQVFQKGDLPQDRLLKITESNKLEMKHELAEIFKKLECHRKEFVTRQLASLTSAQQLRYEQIFGELVVPETDIQSFMTALLYEQSSFKPSFDIQPFDRPWLSQKQEGRVLKLAQIDPQDCSNRNLYSTIQKEWVKKELKLSEVQVRVIQETFERIHSRNGGGQPFPALAVGDVILAQEFQKPKSITMADLPLSEMQQNRLNQLCLQRACRATMSSNCGIGRVQTAIGVTTSQLENLDHSAQEIEDHFFSEIINDFHRIFEMRKKQQQKILDLLSVTQQMTYDKLFGELFPELSFVR